MPNYLFVYYGGTGESPTPEEQAKTMDVWMKWFEKLGKAVVDIGAPTTRGKTVSKAGARDTGRDGVAGYSVIKASNLGQAVNMAKSHPDVRRGMRIAVYEIMPM